ncbi:TetR/AcrR family transcriptional regulator [Streptomyces sp. NPDC058867]|uniref:TetR/AcrR family transcriptional regulator n=1 Tax=unclassified Streptomyces TaxID=2593676 RepID=UPI0036865025
MVTSGKPGRGSDSGAGRAPKARDRNRLLILDTARAVLTENPDAGMDDIAVAAGMVRRTLYGHFATRQTLLASLAEAGATEFMEHVGAIDVRAADPSVEMARLVLRTWGTAKRYGAIIDLARRSCPDELLSAMGPFNSTVAALIRHGQERGVFRSPLDAPLLAHLLEACALTFLGERQREAWSGDEADVAGSHLLLLGVNAADARRAVHEAASRIAQEEPHAI